MRKEDLFQLHAETCKAALRLMQQKNADYTAGSLDPFANFRNSEIVGVPAELGILVRVVDKIKRLETFIKQGKLQVSNESFDDSIMDIINYMILLQGLSCESKKEPKIFQTFPVTPSK